MDRARAKRSSRAASVAAVLAACVAGCVGPRVDVLPGTSIAAAPKSPDCELEVFRTRVDRDYVELAALHAYGGDDTKNGAEDFYAALRAKACELGADALLVTDEYKRPGGEMNAVAIKFRDRAAGDAQAPAPARGVTSQRSD